MSTLFGIGLARRGLGLAAIGATAIAIAVVAPALTASAEEDAGHGAHIERQAWSYAGMRGKFDREQLQRGFQVYQEVCANCHGLKRVYFRNLSEPGGPEFPEAAVKALAAAWPNKIFDGPNDNGDIATRKGQIIKRDARPSDPILGPYDNDKQARAAQNGALPPDLSIITKARNVEYHGSIPGHFLSMAKDVVNGYQEGGSDYLYALLNGYANTPANFKLADGMNFNVAFPGNQIAMAPPLTPGRVTYQSKEVPATVEQYAKDVTAFLAWAADPKLEERKGMGWLVMLYLLVTSVLLYLAKRRLWSGLH